MPEILLILLAFTMISIGLAGIFLPLLPGVPLAWLGLFLYALMTDFASIPIFTVIVFLILTLFATAIDFIAPLIGAKKYNASRYGLAGAALGFLLGIATLGPLGIIAGPLLGAFVGELVAGKTSAHAGTAAWGAFLGFLSGTLIKLVIILIMTGFLLLSIF